MNDRVLLGQISSVTPSQRQVQGRRLRVRSQWMPYPKDAPITLEWKERARDQLLRWMNLFIKQSMSLIWNALRVPNIKFNYKNYRQFRVRSWQIPLGDLESLREHLAEMKRTELFESLRALILLP